MKSKGKSVKGDPLGFDAAAKVLAAGGRVPKKFAKARPVSAGPTLGAAQAQAKVTPARRAAFEILMLVKAGKGHSDELLHGQWTDKLSEADTNLTTALVMGVLRWEIALDARLRTLLQRPDQRLAEPVAMALRLGAFQLLHMDRIPAHAALSESVELCRAAGEPHATGMVNAVLRKVAALPKPGTKVFETTAAFAERLGHPLWLVERWVENYGRDAALKICEADQSESGEGGVFSERDAELPSIDDGSRLVAEIAAKALPQVEGRAARVWDCCAAPGGKTLVLAKRAEGAEVLATDVSTKRMGQMESRLKRFKYAKGVTCEVADAAKLPKDMGTFDLVLCDVPCTGTGTLGRNPEIRERLKVEELVRQSQRQREILAAALGRVALGGRLVYSTCSLEPEENERVVEAVIGSAWRVVPIEEMGVTGLAVEMHSMAQDGALRTLPGVHGCDGFYAVVLERTA
ncbi:RsmB/NOP family class I SAM-dependent RNA methyltransferase [Granulicella tundricola]|uniref:Fmu (Sun) domain protein n=1 Tax=Granulicella tundricola (strain ATCC BAA-1859 / DSM 23138 / MP5ACTX9) TaxID=1198114 RepID=E8X3K8_GRATM|nr:transcription antitermination factor NusB [Granulicella tundricola]ADW68199.1 Fmu (Sun) domain protein [Granulicella tundricola MP5ACTX9]